ncbi:hypothetical protein scyTo_0003648 [Scyliorhinus torazame]|uniref:Uncharacterized protein n=1 Tax=Scyliorhinus torazame TaxID=75743 RepID=A0A401PN49_SCYTO|nr:hypothetical protein [Scyliorhinus torazame]
MEQRVKCNCERGCRLNGAKCLSESMQWRICPDVSQGHPGDLFCNLNMNRSKPDQANLLPALSHPVIYLLKRVYR